MFSKYPRRYSSEILYKLLPGASALAIPGRLTTSWVNNCCGLALMKGDEFSSVVRMLRCGSACASAASSALQLSNYALHLESRMMRSNSKKAERTCDNICAVTQRMWTGELDALPLTDQFANGSGSSNPRSTSRRREATSYRSAEFLARESTSYNVSS